MAEGNGARRIDEALQRLERNDERIEARFAEELKDARAQIKDLGGKFDAINAKVAALIARVALVLALVLLGFAAVLNALHRK